MKTYIIKVEQYINKWVTLMETKSAPCKEMNILEDVKHIQSLLMGYSLVELTDRKEGKYVTITVANGPVRVSYKEAYFAK